MSWQHLNQPQGWIGVISLSLSAAPCGGSTPRLVSPHGRETCACCACTAQSPRVVHPTHAAPRRYCVSLLLLRVLRLLSSGPARTYCACGACWPCCAQGARARPRASVVVPAPPLLAADSTARPHRNPPLCAARRRRRWRPATWRATSSGCGGSCAA